MNENKQNRGRQKKTMLLKYSFIQRNPKNFAVWMCIMQSMKRPVLVHTQCKHSMRRLTNIYNHRQIFYFLGFSFVVFVVAHLACGTLLLLFCVPVNIIVSKVEILLLIWSCTQSSITMLVYTYHFGFVYCLCTTLPFRSFFHLFSKAICNLFNRSQ